MCPAYIMNSTVLWESQTVGRESPDCLCRSSFKCRPLFKCTLAQRCSALCVVYHSYRRVLGRAFRAFYWRKIIIYYRLKFIHSIIHYLTCFYTLVVSKHVEQRYGIHPGQLENTHKHIIHSHIHTKGYQPEHVCLWTVWGKQSRGYCRASEIWFR